MPEPSVFSLNSSHVGLADNLVPVRDVLGIHLIAIGHIEEALPETNHNPNGFKRRCTVVTDRPR